MDTKFLNALLLTVALFYESGIIQIKLLSTSEQTPVFRGTISGIKDEQGEFIKDFKISILPNWIRPDFVYNLFNPISTKPTIFPTSPSTSTLPNEETNRSNNKEYFVNEAQNWLAEVNGSVSGEIAKMVGEAEVSFTTQNEEVREGKEVTSKVHKYAIVILPAFLHCYLRMNDRKLW